MYILGKCNWQKFDYLEMQVCKTGDLSAPKVNNVDCEKKSRLLFYAVQNGCGSVQVIDFCNEPRL